MPRTKAAKTPSPGWFRAEISRKALVDALALAATVADSKSVSIPILQYVKLEAEGGTIRLTATDLDVSLTTDVCGDNTVEGEGALVLHGGRLAEIVKGLPSETIRLERDGERARLEADASRYHLTRPELEHFPAIRAASEIPEVLEVGSKHLADMIHIAGGFITEEESRYSLQAAKLEIERKAVRLVSTDGHQLGMAEIAVVGRPPLETSFLVPKRGVLALARVLRAAVARSAESVLTVRVDDQHIAFVDEHNTLVCRPTSGQFPNWKLVVPEKQTGRADLEGQELAAAVRRANVFTRDTKRVTLEVKPSSVTVTASSDEGDATEVVTSTGDGEVKFGANGRYLAGALGRFGVSSVRLGFTDKESQVTIDPIEPDGITWRYVLMPMRG